MIDLTALSNEQIYSLWEEGISYWQAEYQLTSQETRTRQETLKKLKDAYTNAEGEKLSNATFADMMKALFINPYDDELKQIDIDLHNNVIRAMNEDRLIALGFESPRKANARPAIVPVDLVAQKKPKFKLFSPNDRSLEKGSLKFEEVHFIWRRFVDDALKKAKNPEPPKLIIETPPDRNKAGRPSTREITLKSYSECRELGLIDFSKPKKDAVFTVRSHIKNNHPQEYGDGKGFDDKTVLKHISKEFDANKLKYNAL